MKIIKMRRAVSHVRSKSVDPIKAYKARLEIGIYNMLLDLIAKELEAEQNSVKGDKTKKKGGDQTSQDDGNQSSRATRGTNSVKS